MPPPPIPKLPPFREPGSGVHTPSLRARPIIAVGASTGGPRAVEQFLAELPVRTPPVLVALHMPASTLTSFAEHLAHRCGLEVAVASDGDQLRRGRVLVAPGDRHLQLRMNADREVVAHVSEAPYHYRIRPSVDVLFRSVAELCGAESIGVLLTGMGEDGADGLLRMRNAGAVTIAESQATSVVYGMPGAAVRAGAVQHLLPLDQIGLEVKQRLRMMERGSAPRTQRGVG